MEESRAAAAGRVDAKRLQVPALPTKVQYRVRMNSRWNPWSPPASFGGACASLAVQLAELRLPDASPCRTANGDVPGWMWFRNRVGGDPGADAEGCTVLRTALLRATQASPVNVPETCGHVQFCTVNVPPQPQLLKKPQPPSQPPRPPPKAPPSQKKKPGGIPQEMAAMMGTWTAKKQRTT